MALYLEITSGDQIGQRYSVRSGMTIGRHKADLTLQDSKASGKHASVTMGPDGGLFLIDEGSSNGVKVQGQKVREIELLPGVEFQIGRTLIRVVELDPAEAGEIVNEEPKTWQQVVSALALRAMEEARPTVREITAFTPPLRLTFVQGIQAGTEWIVGYGPREVGPASADLILEEPGLPPICFQLVPHKDGVLLRSTESIEIKVNGHITSSEFLHDGDELDIRTTRVRVSLGA